ncbi:hypothetical protein Scep_005648 [Stephania cephalantha]|uniref:Glycosyl transferase CAP10 domain-containing protein n=1 Tax=Stephania cephalantha TaxID=152367 RepID=A0AAP0KXT9_9MAGN
MESLDMNMVYDYMYHLITEYSKLQNFKPIPPKTAHEVCEESVLCYADSRSKQFLEKSVASASSSPPCDLWRADPDLVESWIQRNREIISNVEKMEKAKANETTSNSTVRH